MMLVQFSAGVSLGSQLEEFSNFPYGNFRFVWKSVSGREERERERERRRLPTTSTRRRRRCELSLPELLTPNTNFLSVCSNSFTRAGEREREREERENFFPSHFCRILQNQSDFGGEAFEQVMKIMKKSEKRVSFGLLDDSESSDSDGGSGRSDEGTAGLKINAQYAKRFEHNKRREEFQRLQEKHPELAARLARGGGESGDASEEDTSTSEDESGDDLIHPKENEDLLRTLVKIKNKDPSIYDAETKFYTQVPDSDGEGEPQKKRKKKKNEKKNTLRNITAKRALEEGAEALAASDDEEEPVVTYNQEQEQARKAFADAANADMSSSDESGSGDESSSDEAGDDLDGFSSKKNGLKDEAPSEETKETKRVTQDLLDEYFGKEDEMEEKDKNFLKNYIINEGWTNKDGDDLEYEMEDREDERHLEEAESFETNYNFRFEEPNSAKIETFPRMIDTSVRKVESKRKRQREAKKERVTKRKEEEALEVKRLKNLKKAEIRDKMEKIRKVAGFENEDIDISAFDLDGDYNPDTFDKQLSKMFNENYYGQQDGEVNLEKTGDGELDQYLEEDSKIIDPASKEVLTKGSSDKVELNKSVADVRQDIKEYLQLDFEDKIGDLKCRFKYSNVKAKTYGMDTKFVLSSSDKELNEIVSIKRLSTYKTGHKDEGNKRLPPSSKYYNKGEKKRAKRAERRARKNHN